MLILIIIWAFIIYVQDLAGKVESKDGTVEKIHSINNVVCKSVVCNSVLRHVKITSKMASFIRFENHFSRS